MNQHTVKAYGDELNQLTAEVARMGGLAEAQVADAVESVARRDIALARAVVDRDVKLDAMHHDIEKKAIRLIALRQPVASDLRKTLAAMKLGTDLERTGDLAKNIAKRALSLAETEPMQPLTRSIERMGKLVSMRLRSRPVSSIQAMRAYGREARANVSSAVPVAGRLSVLTAVVSAGFWPSTSASRDRLDSSLVVSATLCSISRRAPLRKGVSRRSSRRR